MKKEIIELLAEFNIENYRLDSESDTEAIATALEQLLSSQSEPVQSEEIVKKYTASSNFEQMMNLDWTTAEVIDVIDSYFRDNPQPNQINTKEIRKVYGKIDTILQSLSIEILSSENGDTIELKPYDEKLLNLFKQFSMREHSKEGEGGYEKAKEHLLKYYAKHEVHQAVWDALKIASSQPPESNFRKVKDCDCTAPRRQDSMGQKLYICTNCGEIHKDEESEPQIEKG